MAPQAGHAEAAPSIFRPAALQHQAQRQATSALPWTDGPAAVRRLWLVLVLLMTAGAGLAWSAQTELSAAQSAARCGPGPAARVCAVAGRASGQERWP